MKLNYVKIIILGIFLTSVASAQDNFFEDDFAKNPLAEKKSKQIKEKIKNETKVVKEQEPKPEEADEKSKPEPEKSGIKISSLGLIVNGVNINHAKNQISKLIQICQENLITGSKVYFLGPYSGEIYESASFEQLLLLGGIIVPTIKLPIQYSKVKNSPTWIIGTESGEILLEGVDNINQHINSNSEFIAP